MTLQDTPDAAKPQEARAPKIKRAKHNGKKGRAPYEPTTENIEAICKLVSEGETLASIAREPTQPCKDTIYKWLAKNAWDFVERYARARVLRADARADRIDDIRQQVAAGTMRPDQGRVIFDMERWQAGKENPSKYSDKHVIEGGDKPIQIEGDRPALLAAIVAVLQDGGAGDIGTLLTQSNAKPLIEHEVHSLEQGEPAEKPRKNNK